MKFWIKLIIFLAMATVVNAQSPADTVSNYVDLSAVVVTAQYLPTDVRNSVNTVRIINQRTISQRAVTNLEELLQTEAGLRFSQDGVLGGSLSVNGMQGENVKILIDGVPVVGRLNGSVDPGQLPLQNVVQVEIIEGAQSLLYGSDASAGVINLVTKKSQVNPWEASVQAQTESNGFNTLNARVATQSNKWHFALHGSMLHFQPATDTALGRNQLWNPKEQQTAGATLRYKASPGLDIRLTGNWFDELVTNLGEIRRPQFKPYAFDDYYQTTRQDLTLHTEGRTKSNWFWQATLARNQFDRIKNSWRFELEEESRSLLPGEQDTTRNTGWLGRYTIASDQSNKRYNYLAGVEWFREVAEGVRFLDSAAQQVGVAYNTDVGVFASVKGQYLQQRLTAQGGFRITGNPDYGTALTPSLWLMYKPAPGWVVRTSWSQGFRTPGLKERYFNFIDVNHFIVGNPDLKPERSNNYKVEINFPALRLSAQSKLELTANGFFNSVKDRIILTEYALAEYNYANLSEWKTTGAGLSAKMRLGERVRLQSNFLHTGFFNETAADSLRLFNWSPDWSNDLTVSFWDEHLNVNVWHKMTGQLPYFFEEDGQVVRGETEGWHQLNASLCYTGWERKLTLTTGVKNLLDVRQIRTGAATGIGHTGGGTVSNVHWGRTFFVSAKIQLAGKFKREG
ncbi:MAG: TonB-dependent receptor [Saprospiraceae bacterium]